MSGRFITVTGTGKAISTPDLIIISLNLVSVGPEYESAMEKAANEIKTLRNAIVSAGHDGKALKTANFDINTEYESYQDERNNWKQKFAGYRCKHSLSLEFDFSMETLGRTLAAIASCGASPEFHISFSVKDKGAVSARLAENAVADAAQKAALLAKAAGVSLGNIQSINYNSRGELRPLSETKFEYAQPKLMKSASIDINIKPEDIENSDTVTVVWEIE
ncbi:MAG: SIMPL domain-containing protein [Oscillospiraceae bacterium]|nr:SIMPL domain-containing protein [Oscillospiraceae bacterium]